LTLVGATAPYGLPPGMRLARHMLGEQLLFHKLSSLKNCKQAETSVSEVNPFALGLPKPCAILALLHKNLWKIAFFS